MHVTNGLGTAAKETSSKRIWLNNVKIVKIHVFIEKRKHMCLQHMHMVHAAGDEKCYAYFMLHSCVRLCCVMGQHIWSFLLEWKHRKHRLNNHGWHMWGCGKCLFGCKKNTHISAAFTQCVHSWPWTNLLAKTIESMFAGVFYSDLPHAVIFIGAAPQKITSQWSSPIYVNMWKIAILGVKKYTCVCSIYLMCAWLTTDKLVGKNYWIQVCRCVV